MTFVDTITQWREDWLSRSVINHTTVTDPTIQRPGFKLSRRTRSLLNHFRPGPPPRRANLHKWGLAQSSSCDYGSIRPWTTLWTWAHLQNLKADWIYSTKLTMMQSYGWNLQRLQHLQNEMRGVPKVTLRDLRSRHVKVRCHPVAQPTVSQHWVKNNNQLHYLEFIFDSCRETNNLKMHTLCLNNIPPLTWYNPDKWSNYDNFW